jgi:uncharacterized phage-associated protein
MKINKTKYFNAILFFLSYCNNQYLGVTKLNKLLYYLDFISYRDRGTAVTGDKYIHLEYGPVPAIVNSQILPEMKLAGMLDIEEMPYKNKHTVKFASKNVSDISVFNDYEKKLLQAICDEFKAMKTEELVAQTHIEAPWYYSKMFDEIDFKNAMDIDLLTKVA